MSVIGIDANVLTRKQRTGTERYVSELLKAMMHTPLKEGERVVLYVSKPVEELVDLPEGWSTRVLSWPNIKGWTHLRLSLELWLHRPDVFFSPAHEIPLFTPRTKIVSTVHDVAFRALPELYSTWMYRRQQWSVRRQIRNASHLLTVSHATKHDLMTFYRVPESRMTVTHLAIDPVRFDVSHDDMLRKLRSYSLTPRSYLLFMGRIEKKKNIAFLVRAFSASAKTSSDHLVLGGSWGYGKDEIIEAIEASEAKQRIHVLGYVPSADVPALMHGAKAFVFPTNYEGFGIPVLEAMAARVPLVASDIPTLREVAEDAALFADPRDTAQWVKALHQINANRETLVQKGEKRLQDFSWEKTAHKTWHVLRTVLYG